MPRSRFGPLALEGKLGADPGKSSVFSAIHVEQRVQLAVKVFSIPLGGTVESRKELAHEWSLLKKLADPAIARCYGGGFEEADAYLVYELVQGETLEDQVERRGRLPWETVLDYADAIINALVCGHEQQIIHGGLEPNKVVIEPLGQAKVIDYRAQRFDSPYHSNRAPTALQYACRAPELIVSTQNASVKSDLYALGAILYFALTGKPPIQGRTPEEVAAVVATQTPESIVSQIMECPIWFATLIEQLLEKNPEARPFGSQAARLALTEVRRKSASGVGVAEFAAGGFSPLQMKADKAEAKQVLGRTEREKPARSNQSFFDSAWFIGICLLSLVAISAWFMMPLSEATLKSRAEALLASGTRTDYRAAKDMYLLPLVERFPDGDSCDWALDRIDDIDMSEAEYQLTIKLKHGRKIRNEAERLYAQAQEYEQFGDLLTALDKYRSMITLLDDSDKKARPFVNLARRQVSRIESGESDSGQRAKIVEGKLKEAEALSMQGKSIEARKIWYSIVELYQENQEMQAFVERAQSQLSAGTRAAETEGPAQS